MDKITYLFILLCTIATTKQFDLETCRSPIGIETGKVLDSAFSSSSHARENTIASKARIRSETDGWCPLNKISSTTNEYIQIDLVNLTVMTLIELQGKFSLKPNEEFADAFRVEYRREKDQNWIQYKDFSGEYVLSGNSNSYISTIRDILPSIIARQIRIIPIVTKSISKYICMRLELYGCSYQDGLISYSIPQGDKRGYDTRFFDEIYDGQNENGILKNGLGQLTDGILAHDDYRLTDNEQIGYDWIGWKRKSSNMSNISLSFSFDSFRNFTSIRIHTSNLFTRDIYIFHSITILNCEDRNKKTSIIPNDSRNKSARFIYVSLAEEKDFLSNCLNVILTFNNRSKWILISEIQFDSMPMSNNIPKLITIPTMGNSVTNLIDVAPSITRYYHWLLFSVTFAILFIISLILLHNQWFRIYHQHKNFSTRTNHLKLDSTYRTMEPCDTSCTSSISNNDIHHRLIISTTNSSESTHSSEFSPRTISTIYQTNMNPCLTILSNNIPNPIKSIQGPCGNNTYEFLSSADDSQSTCIPCINNKQLIIGQIYSIKTGYFGTIFRGYLYCRHPYEIFKPILIKILTINNTIQTELFHKEHELLHQLNHQNLVHFYGYTTEHNYALIEHSDLGDVYTHLLTSQNTSINIRLYMITQLSNALHYLESHNVIHRDIAARNCLIYPNHEIKLTNSAIASEQFQTHYHHINHIRLPIRWMAPESISNNEFTSQSDIWSFGITLWEIMTNCIALPYGLLDNEQVYQRLKSVKGLHLAKPEGLNKEVIDLMLECWRPFNERPTFQEIYIFFNKRLDGMDIV